MDRFFFYIIGALAALMLTLGAIAIFRTHGAVDPAETVAVANINASPTPASPFVFGGGANSPTAAATPVVIDMPAPAALVSPTPLPWSPPNVGQTVTLTYPGFTIVYSITLNSPVAVQYAMVGGAKPRRWPEPPKVRTLSAKLIADAGYERGAMALQKSISLYFGKQAGRNTDLMTNSSAFNPPCLGGPWTQFDDLEAKWAGQAGWIEVIAGPIFGSTPMQTQNGVVVPTAFYRVYRRSYGDSMAFIIPQTASSPDLTQYLTSISTVEAATGISVFPNTVDLAARDQVAPLVW